MPLETESWIAKLVLDHDTRQPQYTYAHSVGTLLLAATELGPRHWTVEFMASLLLETIALEAIRGSVAMAWRVVALIRFRIAWIREISPASELSIEFVNSVGLSVMALRVAGLVDQASNLAKEFVDTGRAVLGVSHQDVVALAKEAEAAQDKFFDGFKWENFYDELGDIWHTDCDGSGDADVARAVQQDLRKALACGDDPLSTSALGLS